MAAEDSDDAVKYMRGHLYNEQGGAEVEGPDIEFVDHVTGELRQLDVKTFDCAPNKPRLSTIDGPRPSQDPKHKPVAAGGEPRSAEGQFQCMLRAMTPGGDRRR